MRLYHFCTTPKPKTTETSHIPGMGYLLWEQDVAGSNPVTPTIEKTSESLYLCGLPGFSFCPLRVGLYAILTRFKWF